MVNWKTIDELREIFIKRYTNSDLQSELEKACSEEYELKRDYNGRQILELLQNVDDACEESKNKATVKFLFKKNILEVGNTGTTFSEETIERLCLGRASEKSSKKIGNKGTGFRSLLNDAEWIEIHSGKYAIRFSEKYTKELFEKYRNAPLITTQLKNWKKDYELCFPIMNCPEKIEFNSKGFDTLIRVKVKTENEEKETSIKKQLEQPFYKSLLFLPNITTIVIETEDGLKKYTKSTDVDDVLIEKMNNLERAEEQEKYFVYNHKAIIDDKEADLIIAIPKDENYDFSKEKLYCYFPIRNFPTPIKALIHAPFSTNSSRDDVNDDIDQINRKIFLEILSFVKTVSEKIALKNNKGLSIKTVVPLANSKLWDNDSFNLKKSYFEILSTAKILPTVNKDLISINDNPKFFNYDFPEELSGDVFKKLLNRFDNDSNQMVRELANFIKYQNLEYTERELSEKINVISSKTDTKTRVKLFLWWNEHFKSDLPRLLQDTNNDWITLSSKVYLPTDGGVSVLPKKLDWVKLCILRQDYVSEIISQLKECKNLDWKKADEKSQSGGNKRTLAAYSSDNFTIHFIEQSSREQIISTINQQIETVEESVSFINWFFENYGKDLKEGSELSKVKFRLPSRNDKIYPIDELYLGTEYNNPLAEKLFQNTNIKPVASLDIIYKGIEKEEFVLFLKKCGILKYPQIYEDSLWNKSNFRMFVHKKYVTSISINYLFSKTIDNLEKLISSLETKEITDWIIKDENFRNLIISQEANSYAKQQSNWSPWYFQSNAYIKYILNTTAWIELNGTKYPPCRIIKYEKLKDKINGYYGISEQELINFLGKDVVQNFNLDFKKSIAQIPDKDIKLFLDKLPTFDSSGEISRKLYLDIIQFKKDKLPTYTTDNIKLLCKDGKFYNNNEIKYADRKISQSEEKNGHFIYIQPKQSTETIKAWLGVERYKTNLKLENYVLSNPRKEFDAEIKDIKISLLCLIDSNKKNVDTLKRIEIIPCAEIEVTDLEQGNKRISLENYFFVEKDNSFYIKIPVDASIPDLQKSNTFAPSLIDIFKQALTLTLENESTSIELLISKDTQSKRQKIEDWYGVDEWNSSYELLYNRSFTNEQIVQFFSGYGLKTDLLNQISKIDFTGDLDELNFKELISALKEISKDIADLNKYSETVNINIIPHLESEMKKLMNSKYEIYKLKLYRETKDNQKDFSHFLEKLEFYKNFDTSEFKFENSIKTDLTTMLLNNFLELNNICKTEEENPDDIYNKNVEKIISEVNISKDDFDYFIQHHKEEKSILYFEIPETIFKEIKSFLSEDKNVSDKNIESETAPIKSSTVQTKLKKTNASQHGLFTREGRTEKSKKDYENRNAQNENAGKAAEEIAYYELKKTYTNLIWHSKYSKKPSDRNNPPPNGIVCDMWNFDPENGNSYFEVKSATTEFEMTVNEYESMKNNKQNFEVVLVNKDTQEISRHKFVELEEFKQVNGYKFKFEQEKIF